jgi:hypothetical protein
VLDVVDHDVTGIQKNVATLVGIPSGSRDAEVVHV